MIHFGISRNFYSEKWRPWLLVISALNYLSERPFTKNFHDFISVSYVFADLDSVVALKVIKYRVALVLSIIIALVSIFSFILESCGPFFVQRFQYFKIIWLSLRD